MLWVIVEDPLFFVKKNVGLLCQDVKLFHLVDQSDFLIVKFDPFTRVTIAYQTIVMTSSG